MARARIHVLGSLNADLVTRVDRFPAAGETRRAESFAVHAGGKGANQAVAAGKLGAEVVMFGAIGDDPLAVRLRESMAGAGVDLSHLRVCSRVPTGTASIWVDDEGENAIAIAAGANGEVDAAYVDAHRDALLEGAYLLLQGEIPIATMAHLLASWPEGGGRVILDPAPVFDLAELPTERIWLLTPNEHELQALSGRATGSAEDIRAAAAEVHRRHGIERVLCKAGERGAFLWTGDAAEHIPGYRVDAVDTTAAGDAFNGGLATALAEGLVLRDAVRFANAVAALSVTREGAQPAMPDREAVESF